MRDQRVGVTEGSGVGEPEGLPVGVGHDARVHVALLQVTTEAGLEGLQPADDVVELLEVDINDRLADPGQDRRDVLGLVDHRQAAA